MTDAEKKCPECERLREQVAQLCELLRVWRSHVRDAGPYLTKQQLRDTDKVLGILEKKP
jgi:hypothetical protein